MKSVAQKQRVVGHCCCIGLLVYALAINRSAAADLNLQDYAVGEPGATTWQSDATDVLARAISDLNLRNSKGQPTCLIIPAGLYTIHSRLPHFIGAGCLVGAGSSQTIITLASSFEGDLFVWSEAREATAGPTVRNLGIRGSGGASKQQNALVFYDRNDRVTLENVDIEHINGRAIYLGMNLAGPIGYMRESTMRSLRLYDDGTPLLPVIELTSTGKGHIDATNEVRLENVDIVAPRGVGLQLANEGSGLVRDVLINGLRIEGGAAGTTKGDLFRIGRNGMLGGISNISIDHMTLLNPSTGFAALRITKGAYKDAPYEFEIRGFIGGGEAEGLGIVADDLRDSRLTFIGIHTKGTNVTFGPNVFGVLLDGAGRENSWTINSEQTSADRLKKPQLNSVRAPITR